MPILFPIWTTLAIRTRRRPETLRRKPLIWTYNLFTGILLKVP
jgi:hypothetical protein